MSQVTVGLVSTGAANLASVRAALQRCGVTPRAVDDAADLRGATHVVLPGVGSFGPARDRLVEQGLWEALRDRIAEGQPTLAVCLGMQLLAAESEEAPGVAGLGIVSGRVQRFQSASRVPHMGWNRVTPESSTGLLQAGDAYFANSYRLIEAPAGWRVAWCTYDDRFVAAMERGNVLACQFHPELSGSWGQQLLERWLRRSARPVLEASC